jgi:hypothetical protein
MARDRSIARMVVGYLGAHFFIIKRLLMKSRLQQFSDYIKEKTLQLFRYRVIVAGVIFFSAPIWIMDQGQDLLINCNSQDTGVIFLIIVILIAAFLNWYLAKLFFTDGRTGAFLPYHAPQPQAAQSAASEKKVTRFLGVATILIPAVAILNAQKAIRIDTWMSFIPPVGWLVIFLLGFFFLIKTDIVCKYFISLSKKIGLRKAMYATAGVMVLLGLVLPLLIKWNIDKHFIDKPYSLVYLFWHLILLAICFVIFVSIRENLPLPVNGLMGSRIGIPVLLAGLLLTLLFLFTNLDPLGLPDFAADYIALPVLLSGLVFYILLFTLLIRMGQKWRINVVLFLLLILLICSTLIPNRFHEVQQIPRTAYIKTLSLPDYFREWIKKRKPEMDGLSDYPVFLVNSYGGGIRAAAFTGMTLSFLDSATFKKDPLRKKGFEHYVFSISGASGGTIGALIQCAYRNAFLEEPSRYSYRVVEDFYRHDFLTPVLGGLLGRDVWASATGQPLWNDRSAVQENLWAEKAHSMGIRIDQEFDSYWDLSDSNVSRLETPLLFSNSLNVDDGLKGIFAPVQLDHADFPATHFIRDSLDSGKTLSLVTAGFLSARFPFISPSGKIKSIFHYMDGGGKDNSGASTSSNIFLTLVKFIQQEKKYSQDSAYLRILDKIHFYFVSISNSSHVVQESRRRIGNRFEVVSPVVGILNSGIDGNARAADSALKYIYGGRRIHFEGLGFSPDYFGIWPTMQEDSSSERSGYLALLPLGWQISQPSLDRLNETFRFMDTGSGKNDLGSLLNVFPLR